LMQRTKRSIQTRFRYAYTYRLKLARYTKSLTHYTKGTLSPRTNLGLQLFVGIRFQVLFHSPRRGAFHLSLTVLVRYRSCTITLALIVVDPYSNNISRVPPYSRT